MTNFSDKVVCRDLSLEYPIGDDGRRHRALDRLTLNVRRNEFLCVVGPSGCGKSTLISAVAGFLRPSGGELLVDGRPVTGPGADRGVVFQEYALLPWKNVLENTVLGLKYRALPKAERLREGQRYLELVGLAKDAAKYPHELSGGMKQRVAVARTMINKPEIMMMDEPFAAIDAQNRMILQEELLQLWGRSEITVIFVTHSVEEAVFLADRVAVLSRGPGRLLEIVDIDIPRGDRNWKDIEVQHKFIDAKSRILDLVRH